MDQNKNNAYLSKSKSDVISAPIRASGHIKTADVNNQHSVSSNSIKPRLLKIKNVFKSQKTVYYLSFSLVILVLVFGFIYTHIESQRRYDLTATEQQVITKPDSKFMGLISYSNKNKTYTVNQAAFSSSSASSSYGEIGAGVTPSTASYGAKIPNDSAEGVTVTDKHTGLSFSVTPLYKTMAGKSIGINGKPIANINNTAEIAHFIYPVSNLPADVVETPVPSGVIEDLLIPKKSDLNKLSLSYRLSLPNTLTAKLNPDGAVGIYSASPALFGNISYGSNKDQQLVQAARTNGPKTNLLFELPAPSIRGQSSEPRALAASYSLNGDVVSVNISNLRQASYPISIDPSIIDSASTLASAGIATGDSTFGSGGNEVATNNVSGGTLGSGWTETNDNDTNGYIGSEVSGGVSCTIATTDGVAYGASVAYNGYLYAMGGVCNNNGGNVINIDYALICTGSNSGSGGCSSTAGTIGGWNVSTSTNCFNASNNANFTAQVYNGYIYILGGSTNSGSSVTAVQYTKINSSNGSVGSCSTGTSLNTAVSIPGSAVYDGYIYVIGGCTTSCATAAYEKTVQSAPLNPDGSIGSWTTLTNQLLVKAGYSAAVYNGYVYVAASCVHAIGGCTSSTTNVEYAQLVSGGNTGVWNNTSAFTQVLAGQTLFASAGYLYLAGGRTGSTFPQTVQYASINSDGTIGAWNTTTSLSNAPNGTFTGRSSSEATVYNNVLYMTGGETSTAIDYAYDTIDAPLDPAGTTNAPATAVNGTLPAGSVYSNSAVLNGFLYIIGGCTTNTCNALGSNIYFSSINSSGSLTSPGVGTCSGVWCTATATYTIGGAALAAYNGYLTIIGGCTAVSSGSCTTFTTSDVYEKPSSNGDIASAFTSDSANLSSGRWLFGSAVYNNYVYLLGGLGSSSSIQNVAFAQLSPAGGVVSSGITSCNGGSSATWCDVSGEQLLHTNDYSAAFAYNGYLYITGGYESGSSSPTTDIFVSQITNSGNLSCPSAVGSCTGDWAASSTAMPVSGGIAAQGTYAYRGYVYVVGGRNSSATALSTVYYAQLNSNGSIGSFSQTNSLNTTRNGGTYLFNDGNLIAVGGENASSANTSSSSGSYGYELMNIGNGGPGILGASASASTSAAAAGQAVVAYNGYLYDIGGCTAGTYPNCTTVSSSINYALICTTANSGTGGCSGTAGTTGTWSTTTTALPSGRYDFGAAIYNGYLYITGGCTASCTTPDSDTQSVQIDSNGNITASWSNLASFSTARFGQQEDIYNGFIYVLGGCSVASSGNCAASGDYLGDTQYASLNSSGGISGSWAATNSFTTNRDNFGSAVYDGYIYIMGGLNSSGNDLNDVQVAYLNSGGTITSGAWTNTTPLPQSMDSFASVAYDGELYVLGGNNSGALSSVDFADIGNDGNINNWQPTTSLSSSARLAIEAVATNGYIFAPGGYDAGYLTTTPAAPIYSMPRIGSYAALIDLTGATNVNPTIDAIIFTGSDSGNAGSGGFNGTPGSGGIQSTYQLASDGCMTFGSLTNINYANLPPLNNPVLISPVNNGCSGANQSIYNRYVLLILNLDDSQTASFPDATGNHSTINSISIYYHPQTNTRMRGGGTLLNGSKQSLDTPPT